MTEVTKLPDRTQLVVDVWAKVVTRMNEVPPPNQDTATDVLQVDAPGLSDADGDAFFLVVAQKYQDLGINSQNTYIALRNEINQAGEAASNLVFETIKESVVISNEGQVLGVELEVESIDAEILQIPTDITTIETQRDLESDAVLIEAYNDGIDTKNNRKDFLNSLKISS